MAVALLANGQVEQTRSEGEKAITTARQANDQEAVEELQKYLKMLNQPYPSLRLPTPNATAH